MNDYERERTCVYEGRYTPEEVELNKRLYEECSRDVLECATIETLLTQGADPLGATAVFGWGLLEHVYGEIVCDSHDSQSVNLPKITELFLKHGMNISSPRIPYDNDNSINPLWDFSFVPNENSIIALKMLLDNGLDVESVGAFLCHSIDDEIDVHRSSPNDPDYNDWFVWTFKMVMLIATYDYILNNDKDLCRFIGLDYNNYDVRKFKEWNDYRYEFDTSRCKSFAELCGSVVRIIEVNSNKEVWKIGVCLKPEEL